ncbi:MAG: DUF4832 domain-containing protein [Lentisphaeria bacterium]|nr:DUF4832 domain-containing protein [Lentisphaeria bacterium]
MHRFLVLVCFLAFSTAVAEPKRMVVRPEDTGEALENPSMGWVFHHFDNSIRQYGPALGPGYGGEGFPGLSVAYLRLAWCHLEPEDGVFDWSLVDTVAQRYIGRGRQIAFRFTCFESGDVYATPKWLKDAGVGGRWFKYGVGVVVPETPGATWEPDYDDPLFLARLDRFLAAAALRYDGNPNVAFVDIGSIGIWGEGNPCTRGYPLSMYKTHIDLHFKHFKKTLLVGLDDWRPRVEFRFPGVYRNAFAIRKRDGLRGRTLHVRVGVWLPGDAGKNMPEGRFLPAHGLEDRRVQLGVVHMDADSRMQFTQADIPANIPAAADFAVRLLAFRERDEIGFVEVEWTVRRVLPLGTRAFCHMGDAEKDIRQNCAFGMGRNEALDYARSLGATMRDDSIIYKKGVRFRSEWMAADFWRDRPVVLESGHYWSNDWSDGADQDYFDAIEAYHGSYISIHGPPDRIWKDHADIIRRMNLRIGYRLQLVEVSWPDIVVAGRTFTIRGKWRNAGVAPCYPGGHPAFTLKDGTGAIRAVLAGSEFDMRALEVGAPEKAPVAEFAGRFRLPRHLPTGEYDLFVSVGDLDGTPHLALPLPHGDGEKRYRIGRMRMRIDGDYRLRWEQPVQVDGEWRLPVVFETLKPLPDNVHPFGHLDCESRIVKGLSCSVEGGLESLQNIGAHAGFFRLAPPEKAQGKPFSVHLGLWVLRGRRILSENGEPDLRVPVGFLTFDAAGTPHLRQDPVTP